MPTNTTNAPTATNKKAMAVMMVAISDIMGNFDLLEKLILCKLQRYSPETALFPAIPILNSNTPEVNQHDWPGPRRRYPRRTSYHLERSMAVVENAISEIQVAVTDLQ